MAIDEYLRILARSPQHRCLYHFTDSRNLPSIRQHGLLSMQEIKRLQADLKVAGGNDWSLEADAKSGMDRYVHLCFFNSHPMEFRAKQEGRLVKTAFLRIDPQIVSQDGVLLTDDVSNQAGVIPRAFGDAIAALDLEVIYQRTDWKSAEIQQRMQRARRYEILVPKSISPNLILNLNG